MPNAYIVEKDFHGIQFIYLFNLAITTLIGYLLFPKSILLALAFIILVSTLLNLIIVPQKYRTRKLDRIKIMEGEIRIFENDWNLKRSYPLNECKRIIFHAPKSYDKKLFPFFTLEKRYALEFDFEGKREIIYLLPDSKRFEKIWNQWYREYGNGSLKSSAV